MLFIQVAKNGYDIMLLVKSYQAYKTKNLNKLNESTPLMVLIEFMVLQRHSLIMLNRNQSLRAFLEETLKAIKGFFE